MLLVEPDLLGHALVLDFVFTTCTGPCPRVSANMAKVQELVKATKVKLATFTVEPETDTPEVLTKYAAEHGADAPAKLRELTAALAEAVHGAR